MVPFGNVTRSEDLGWLRDASVNLLSLEMSRWTDVNVVPDKRVGDLVRELPIGRGTEALTLSDGIAIARRAGAGMLVMGDFFRIGNGARVVANVFDVRTGTKLRAVTKQSTEPDSLLTAFGPLAQGVLAVPPPVDVKTGDVGTLRLDAYQAYLLGVKALNRFDLGEARKQLTLALSRDSTFALAHLKFAMLLEWSELSTERDLAKSHALAARRFGASLPRRERTLIDAGVAHASEDYARVCTLARTLIAQDSTDSQGYFLLGECSYHDNGVEWSTRDSTIGVFRGNWNTAIRSFEKVIELDPTYLGAFEHVIQLSQRTRRLNSFVLRSGDTLETVPLRASDRAASAAQYTRFVREKPLLASHALAVRIARRWVDADTNSQGARYGLMQAAMMSGDLALADAQLRRLTPRVGGENVVQLRMMLEVAAKSGHGVLARAVFDSLVKSVPNDPTNAMPRGAVELVFGRIARFDGAAVEAGMRIRPEAAQYQRHVARALLGLPRDSLARDEAAFFATIPVAQCDAACRVRRINLTLLYALHTPSPEVATLVARDSTTSWIEAARALAARDTAQLRRAAVYLDTMARARAARGEVETNSPIATDAYVALGDSMAALRMARFFVDTSMVHMSISSYFFSNGIVDANGAALWPRMMLRRADLAAAAGQRDEARVWYGRVLDLWADADAELQPTISRIRTALAALGPAR